jgi:hypothetical protein
MWWATFTFAGLIFAGMVSAQDLAPECFSYQASIIT